MNNLPKLAIYTPEDVEILVSTMKRTSLSFLGKMFVNNDISKHHILIINQTDKEHQLISNVPNVRVINCQEVGLSKSRNLAIKNTVKPIFVITDDDVVFSKDFAITIAAGYTKYPEAGFISFQANTFTNKPYKKYNNKERELVKKRKEISLSSIEITCKTKDIVENKILFDERFGLGSYFKSGEESIFFQEILSHHIKAYHIPKVIVCHAEESSTSNPGSNKFIRARAAAKYLQYGNLSILWMVKFLSFLIRKKHIKVSSIIKKYKEGYQAIGEIRKM
ncbi:Glycosyltransferase, GT2 family [Mesonia phycicola]|uniref:Glycosyltransferase, GT2 family n=1 Tax=Mesonia phycicola TaxID=579105 RepID=A0A1M6GJ59_9FLAO|nr:glycosyltransferase family A protein [Mesonia phycicola]SHJ09920.1 Glycosyltransferase, GT2 family [Mesonia phycicola]